VNTPGAPPQAHRKVLSCRPLHHHFLNRRSLRGFERQAVFSLRTKPDCSSLPDLPRANWPGFPLEHILGWVEFCGLRIAVDAGVFVPRRRTELLVREAITLTAPGAVVLDLCCGCGALGAALTAAVRDIELYAADIEPASVDCTRRNLGLEDGHVFEGDLFDPLPRSLQGQINVLLCNTPYVPTDEIGMMPPEARLHEPRVTRDGGPDGLDVQRKVAAEASTWLAPGGHLLVETSEGQAPHTAGIFARNGLLPRIVSSDELDATVVIGTRPSPSP
jgi:release factor glutamine methyltransferase